MAATSALNSRWAPAILAANWKRVFMVVVWVSWPPEGGAWYGLGGVGLADAVWKWAGWSFQI